MRLLTIWQATNETIFGSFFIDILNSSDSSLIKSVYPTLPLLLQQKFKDQVREAIIDDNRSLDYHVILAFLFLRENEPEFFSIKGLRTKLLRTDLEMVQKPLLRASQHVPALLQKVLDSDDLTEMAELRWGGGDHRP
jgi:hypothetical protein